MITRYTGETIAERVFTDGNIPHAAECQKQALENAKTNDAKRVVEAIAAAIRDGRTAVQVNVIDDPEILAALKKRGFRTQVVKPNPNENVKPYLWIWWRFLEEGNGEETE